MSRFRKAACAVLAMFVLMQTVVLPVCASEVTVPPETQLPAETIPVETIASVDPSAEETEPAAEEETAPAAVETEPVESVPAETIPVETLPPETVPVGTIPEEIIPEETAAPVPAVQSPIPLYFQTDYPNTMYGSGTIASSGCSITALAMVATYLTGIQYLPDELAGYFGGNGNNNMERLEYGSQMLQLPYTRPANWHETLRELQAGKVAIAVMNSQSIFSDYQHFIVLAGITEDGKILVNDPYAPNYERWDLKNAFMSGFESGDISCGFSGAWVYDKAAMPEVPFIYTEAEPVREESRYPDIQLTDEERKMLASVVWVEAQSESLEGQQAVAEVILNRLASGRFSSTLRGIVYAEGQFLSAAYLDTAEPTQAQYEVIDNALYGPYVLPMEVYHFATYPVNENVWGQIGGHIFCYGW